MSDYRLILGDCREALPTLPSGSVDAVLTDPPYPCIKRDYGTWTEAEWFDLMRAVVPECMRLLKPTGSAVFILQPNSERLGRMRTWLWEFLVWVGKEWGIVQDAYWWNHSVLPTGGAAQAGLMRGSLKMCVWVGSCECYRNQSAVLWNESQENKRRRLAVQCGKVQMPSGHSVDYARNRNAAVRRGGVTPFNVLPLPGVCEEESKVGQKHPAMTPLTVCDWWVRYLCPPGGTVLDPFVGSGTSGIAALKEDRSFIGIEKVPAYYVVAQKRLAEAASAGPLFAEVEA